MEALPKSQPEPSGLVNLVFSRQTVFSSASIRLAIKPYW